ncbi:MAG: DUF4097 family beta strand repeat protein, partial [Oscillospiraceae bacterium]|nr:DUF4097 family beta strand repeat protein [Oscillospiraceae bacterium]
MKIKKKLTIIIPCTVILIGIILIVTGLAKGALTDYKNTLELTDFEANVPSGSIYNLDVDVSLADINVICTNDVKDFNIKAENITKDFIEYTTSNNTLKLRYDTQKWYQTIFVPAYRENKGKIDLYIPAGIKLRDVEITAGYGELNVSYLTAERAFLSCKNGDNHIKNLTCDYTEINNDGANINGVNIDAKNADLNLDSDMAVFSNFITDSLILKNDGDLKLSGMINGDSSFKSDGGDVNITLYSDD